jgi:hypothetical protein
VIFKGAVRAARPSTHSNQYHHLGQEAFPSFLSINWWKIKGYKFSLYFFSVTATGNRHVGVGTSGFAQDLRSKIREIPPLFQCSSVPIFAFPTRKFLVCLAFPFFN